MTRNYFFINEANPERVSNYIGANWQRSAAGADGKCSFLHPLHTGKVEAHDYTSRWIDKGRAIA